MNYKAFDGEQVTDHNETEHRDCCHEDASFLS